MADKVSFSGNTVTITLENPLKAATTYHVRVDATAITDAAGNAFAGISDADTLSFTTEEAAEDETPPALQSSAPAAAATDVPVDSPISLTFDKAVQAGTGSITISDGADDERSISVEA